MKNLLTWYLGLLSFVSCQADRDLRNVKVGMRKAEVINILGGPDSSSQYTDQGYNMKLQFENMWYGDNARIMINSDTVYNIIPDQKKHERYLDSSFTAVQAEQLKYDNQNIGVMLAKPNKTTKEKAYINNYLKTKPEIEAKMKEYNIK